MSGIPIFNLDKPGAVGVEVALTCAGLQYTSSADHWIIVDSMEEAEEALEIINEFLAKDDE